MEKDSWINPFDRITEDNEKGIRVPNQQTHPPDKKPEVVFVEDNGDEEIIYF